MNDSKARYVRKKVQDAKKNQKQWDSEDTNTLSVVLYFVRKMSKYNKYSIDNPIKLYICITFKLFWMSMK